MTPVFQGFPIRTSSDQSSFTNSPRLIAGYNVLLRLLVPRHPPIALSSLLIYKDARVHCEVLKIRARPTNQHPQQASTNRFTQKSRRTHATDPSKPNSVLRQRSTHQTFHSPKKEGCTHRQRHHSTYPSMFHNPVPARPKTNAPEPDKNGQNTQSALPWLLRKEVIQPHLPVRLPCYDLVLITGPTFDGSLHKG